MPAYLIFANKDISLGYYRNVNINDMETNKKHWYENAAKLEECRSECRQREFENIWYLNSCMPMSILQWPNSIVLCGMHSQLSSRLLNIKRDTVYLVFIWINIFQSLLVSLFPFSCSLFHAICLMPLFQYCTWAAFPCATHLSATVFRGEHKNYVFPISNMHMEQSKTRNRTSFAAFKCLSHV